MLKVLTDAVRAEQEYAAVLSCLRMQKPERHPRPMLVSGLADGAREIFYAAAIEDMRAAMPEKPVLCILPDEKEILKVQMLLTEQGKNVLVYPFRDFIFHNITASRDYEQQRIAALTAMEENGCDAVLTTPDAALSYTVPRAVLKKNSFRISADEAYALDDLVTRLCNAGYARVELVDGVGQFAVRGGILDIFPCHGDYPVRMEFFGDEIDAMGIFDPMTQRKIEECDVCVVPPARELLLNADSAKALRTQIAAQLKRCKKDEGKTVLTAELEAMDSGTELGFLDKYITFLYPEKECLLDYTRNAEGRVVSAVLIQETQRIRERISVSEYHMREAITALLEDGAILPKYAEYTRWQADFDYYTENSAALLCDTFASGLQMKLSGLFTFASKQMTSYDNSYATLLDDVRHYGANRYRILLCAENRLSAENLQKQLFDDGIGAEIRAGDTAVYAEMTAGIPVIVPDADIEGFELSAGRFCVLSTFPAHTAYAKAVIGHARARKKKKSAAEKILSYADLTVGDYIVHQNHGIGRYMGIETIRGADGAYRDHIKLQYADGGAIFLPCDQLDMISKYIGAHAEDGTVKLSSMGGGEWAKTKARVKAAAKDMAKELVALYATRMRRQGFAFSADDEMQRAFESVFPYEETDCQNTAIAEIKADMQASAPMDRLLCGDVGYGKTEVALRAAMKAVENGKQVALLVPTTILALQHYQTILARFRGLPVHADILSRFRTPKQQAEILRRLRRGEIDIIVGTHRLVSKDVGFRDLGLVIIDEEQRFGVAHKERLKQLSENVDCLTLTATPIPRTLNMAMSGIRDMSILDEAPGDRVPTQTYVLEYDETILGEALKKELRRGGQVFWLHNRVEDIDVCASRVAALCPDATIAIAHGQMDKEEIGRIWQKLLSGEVDILISTTIIETGIDIPNANTLVIENADRMGLSQLHQIRGRIGRSSRRAYAYFTYPKAKILSEVATKRLQAIKEYAEFGSGFKIAMRDMEIRGAGNVLGAEQHGHMESVGYDLYIKLLNEAILEEKGVAVPTKTESVVDVSVDAYLPESYVRSGAQRIDLYKKIAAIETTEDKTDILDELCDRYGTPPKAVENLVRISYLRSLASECRFPRLEAKGMSNEARIFLESFSMVRWTKTSDLLSEAAGEKKEKQAGAKAAQPKPVQAGKYTPLARAAALARKGREDADSAAASQPIRLTVSAGQKPSVLVRIPRGTAVLDALTQVLEVYRTTEKE